MPGDTRCARSRLRSYSTRRSSVSPRRSASRLSRAGAPAADALLCLIDASETVGSPRHGLWKLESAVRKSALRRLKGADAALRALSANRHADA